jgi:predicted nucleic acid-binding protein
MPDLAQSVVTNTTPLIALAAATGSLEALRFLYARVLVPYEVAQEIRAGGHDAFGVDVFESATWLEIGSTPVVLSPYLQNALDRVKGTNWHTPDSFAPTACGGWLTCIV